MDSLEFKITSVIEKATKFYQRKQRHNINFSFLPSAGVPQQTHTYLNTWIRNANGSSSLQFNPPLLRNSRIGIPYCNSQIKNTYDNNIDLDINALFFDCVVFPYYLYTCIRGISRNLKCNLNLWNTTSKMLFLTIANEGNPS